MNDNVIHHAHKTHGMSTSKIYGVWCTMKSRCNNPHTQKYNIYGGRGIKVCDEWQNSFESFYAWAMSHGYSDGLTIDRIDSNGDYTPDNCRWVSLKAQERNRRDNHIVSYNGMMMPLVEACEQAGISYDVAKVRINKLGWDAQKALDTPVTRYEPITYNGETMSLNAWARKLGINRDTLRWRIKRCGWPIDRAMTEQVAGGRTSDS